MSEAYGTVKIGKLMLKGEKKKKKKHKKDKKRHHRESSDCEEGESSTKRQRLQGELIIWLCYYVL